MADKATLRAQGQNTLSRKMLTIYRNFQAVAAAKYAAQGYVGLGLAHTFLVANVEDAGTRIVVLAERMGTTKQFAGRLVQELETRGFLKTTADPTDKRATLVQTTPLGEKFLEDACRIRDEMEAEYQTVLGATLYSAFVEALERLGGMSNLGQSILLDE